MTEYVWQLGIDWNAIQTGGVSYLRGGLVKKVNGQPDVHLPGTAPVQAGDQITFRIFDVTSSTPPAPSSKWVTAIGSFGIDSQAAVKGPQIGHPLSNPQPTIGLLHEPAAEVSLFGNAYCSWDSEPVTVAVTSGRFLLTVYLQATGSDGVVRLFNHDPEMVVGPNG
ncbi:MAG TPA: hypothetical protein VLQ45_27385 [Thermoanaerobaculia bacterium]|nr:hypothetical protein [Thermoanaerobaculia bacterium]